jgi:hypothetical protein
MISTKHARSVRSSVLASTLMLAFSTRLPAQTSQPASDRPSPTTNDLSLTQDRDKQAPKDAPSEQPKEAPAKKPAFYTTKGWSARPEPEPPTYVKSLDQFGFPGCEKMKWLDFGMEQRTRFEYRNHDYRVAPSALPGHTLPEQDQFLLRSRTYVGIHDILDPFRAAVEFQDSRQFNSALPEVTRDVDENDFLQAYGELYFKNALGEGYPLALRAGRMTLAYTDTHTVSRSAWSNTTQAFDGFRLRLGQPSSDWQLDFFAAQPVEKRMRQPDHPDEERWFYGLVGAWRKWQQYITLEPYYLILDEDRTLRTQLDRTIHTLGLHGFGPIGKTGFDYDWDAAYQLGEAGPDKRQRAFGTFGELGYTFNHPWKPRLSSWTMYASGERDPRDVVQQRFARMFDSTHAYSTSDYFTWQNVISTKLRLELKPTDKLRFDTSYGGYWLASDTDAWITPSRIDATGRSGDFVGQEIDARLRYQLNERVEFDVGYAHFFPGTFANNTGPSPESDFLYVQTRLQL